MFKSKISPPVRLLSIFTTSLIFTTTFSPLFCQQGGVKWSADGNAYYRIEFGEIFRYQLPAETKTLLVDKAQLTPPGSSKNIIPASFALSTGGDKLLIFTNTKKVWRLNTRGDYWVIDTKAKSLKQLGKNQPVSSLMFAKFSPDGNSVAYVSDYNLYVEDLQSGNIKQLTADGNRKLINGTFDWVYEEEFFCRDGFRWSPDSKQIAFWQIDAQATKDYLMINNTDSIYPFALPVEYPVSGEVPSPFKIGVVSISGNRTTWMKIPTDPRLGSYVPRMEWAAGSSELIVQHLSRRQNASELLLCNASSGESNVIFNETDSAWIDILGLWDAGYIWGGWDWLNSGKDFLWASEKDGWRHIYSISRDGKKQTLITKGNYDVMDIVSVDEKSGLLYFIASPDNATQSYLYRIKLDGKGNPVRVSPMNQRGTHRYDMGPGGNFALHTFSNSYTPLVREFISMADHRGVSGANMANEAIAKADSASATTRFFKVKTAEGVEMDGWMVKPLNFDSSKKYPVVFFVYTEPWGQNVIDEYGTANNRLYKGNMPSDGYVYISIDNRGTPVPKGRAWRKSIYRKIGRLNIADQAAAAKEILKWNFIDTTRVAVWGWSGGGSATLNLMFQYPEIYKTGIAIAAVSNQRTYDNVYQERYMGLPEETSADYVSGSPITYAKNLKGNLLYIHGTGDDNVHFNNAELLINELVKHNRQFQLMLYPNRTHTISEGAGTASHLSTLYTEYLKKNCPPGPR